MKNKGFTLIELLVVIVIIGIISTIAIPQFSGYFGKARDSIRVRDISNVHKAIMLYYATNSSYPSTGGLNNVYMDLNCTASDPSDQALAEWVPGLSAIMGILPQDPTGENQPRSTPTTGGTCYMYSSDGTDFILSAWGTVETGPQEDLYYSRAGFREGSWNITQANYICNNTNVGGNGDDDRDYYKHSYTITSETLGCTW